jgi:uncharacterized protein YecE (DUF72 family)
VTAVRPPQLRIGISGWSYPGWRGLFYPRDLPARRHLEYASRRMNAIEINASFYRLQRPEHYRTWYEQTPPGFQFCVKGSRFITHNRKLRDVDTALANFFASGILLLREKLGPFVWQLSERLRFDASRIEGFVERLPRDTRAAARLAERHDWRLDGRAWTRPGRRRRLRHALEVRNTSWLVPELVRILRRHRVALVLSDAADWPYAEEVTADFVYLRLHGSERTYGSRYDDAALDHWAARIRTWLGGREPDDAVRISRGPARARSARDVYVFFDNDWMAFAPHDAMRLADRLRDREG